MAGSGDAVASVDSMDLADLAGQTFGPRDFDIAGLAVADFVDVTGDEGGRWNQVAPPGFVAAALFVVAPDLLGQLEDRSVLHGEQTFAWAGPLTIGSNMEVTGEVTRVRERGGVTFVGFDVEVSSGSAIVASGTSMFLVSGDATATQLTERAEPSVYDRGSPRPGQTSYSRNDLVRYAAATRDYNPIHWDHETAVGAGLPGVVVHGLAQAAWGMVVAARRGSGHQPLATAKIRFRNPLLPATPVYIRDEVSENVISVSVTDDTTEYLAARIELAGE